METTMNDETVNPRHLRQAQMLAIKANIFKRASLDIIRRCEARDRAVDQQLKAR
jgi:hypothetical protein